MDRYTADNRIYLKKNYHHEIFERHGVTEQEIDFLFDKKKRIKITQNTAFHEERIDAEINAGKGRKIKIIFMFDPTVQGKEQKGKVGIITAFTL